MSVFKYVNNTSKPILGTTNVVGAYDFIQSTTRLSDLEKFVNNGLQLYVNSVEQNSFVEYVSDNAAISLPNPDNSVPSWWRKRANSIMWLGDSITAQGGHLPNTPYGKSHQVVFPAYSNINSLGLFVISTELGSRAPTGTGTLKYYAATGSMTWQIAGDTEGPQVKIPTSGFYALTSGTGGEATGIYIAVVNRYRPIVDKQDTVTINALLNKLCKNNTASHGFCGWSHAILGPVFGASYNYGIPTIRASEWLEAQEHWKFKYTDITVVCLGTNDITDQASAIKALEDVTAIIKLRLAIGSLVVAGCLFPYGARPSGGTAAVLWFNRGIRALAETLNIDVFDSWPFLADPIGTGGYAAGMSLDTLHPSALGGFKIAKRTIVPILKKYVGVLDGRQFAGSAYNAITAPYGNLLINGQLTGTGGTNGAGSTGEVPTSWTCVRNSGSVISSVAKSPDSSGSSVRTDGQLGKYATFTVSNVGGVNGESMMIRQSTHINTGWSVGDYLVIEGDIRISGTAISYLSVAGVIGVRNFYGISPQTDNVMGDLEGDTVSIPFRSAPLQIEAGDTNLNVNIIIALQAGGTAILDLGQTFTVHKIPAPI